MATLTVQQTKITGTAITYVAAAGGGDKFNPDERTVLRVKNGGGAPITVTPAPSRKGPGGQAIAGVGVAVAAGAEAEIGPFPAADYRDPSDGLCAVAYSGVTTVTVAAVRR